MGVHFLTPVAEVVGRTALPTSGHPDLCYRKTLTAQSIHSLGLDPRMVSSLTSVASELVRGSGFDVGWEGGKRG